MIWTLRSADLSKEFQYLISCVLCASTGQPCGFLSLPLTHFNTTLPFALGWEIFHLEDGIHIFIYLCNFFYWRQMHFLSSDYAAGIPCEWRPHRWELAHSKTWLFWQPFKHFIWVGFYQRKNTGSVDNHGIVMNPRKTQYFWVWAIRNCLAVLVQVCTSCFQAQWPSLWWPGGVFTHGEPWQECSTRWVTQSNTWVFKKRSVTLLPQHILCRDT